MSSIYNFTDTWNNAAVQYFAIKCNITNTASLNTSGLQCLQIGGVNKWLVGLTGIVVAPAAATTIASAATIAPTNPIHFVSGVAAIATITAPPLVTSTGGQITLIPTGIFTWTAAGNIALAGTAVVGKAIIFTYDATTVKWYPSYT